ncbi:MAG: STAS domain-containing protein [Bdellovibrionales bacterium]|nr:STAS domain-containing protein [Bdellovibrionales bacterium]
MKAFIKKSENNVVIINLKGEVDFASAEPFHQICMDKLSKKNIVFNLKNLNFVGSDGLSSFMNTIKDLNTQSTLQFCCVGSEFRRVFAQSEIKDIAIYDDEQSAVATFQTNEKISFD